MKFFTKDKYPSLLRWYPKLLLILLAMIWLLLAIKPVSRSDWALENLLPLIALPLLILTYKKFRFSNFSYSLIFLFMTLHFIGAHYTYAKVPVDWTLFGFERNMYDRVVHFLNGFLLFYPIREFVSRITKVGRVWSFFLPLGILWAASGAYEIIEWMASLRVDEVLRDEFLGMQGDMFDSTKDMALAFFGAFLAMILTLTSKRKE